MAEQHMNILQISASDRGGGAEQVAWNLFQAYHARGHSSWLAAAEKTSRDPDVFVFDNTTADNLWQRCCRGLDQFLAPLTWRAEWISRLRRTIRSLAEPGRWLDHMRGIEDFRFPGIWRIFEQLPGSPDVIHCHNLHGGYFDLRALPWLSSRAEVFLTLHDAWLLSGHCAHSFDCPRWQSGCGECPDLRAYPGIRRDATAANWQRKKDIYAQSRLHVATPCRWLMDKVESSMLACGIIEARVIPYGVDLTVFQAADKQQARRQLDLPPDGHVLLFAAKGIRANAFKDYATMRAAVTRVAEAINEPLLFVALGEDAPPESLGRAEIRFVPFERDPACVARYYQAANLYLHAARADTFPNTVLEALACGTPVVATAVGGIPEQINGLNLGPPSTVNCYPIERATGILTPPADAEAFSAAIQLLLGNRALLARLSANAARDAAIRFDLDRHTDDYLNWYRAVRMPAGQQAGTCALSGGVS